MKKTLYYALLGYILLTILLTWPTVTQLTTAIPGDGFDGWQNYWNQWWIKEALLNRRTHFFFTKILYPPLGTSLLFHTLNFFNGLWTLPLQLNFGLAVAYNAVVFFHFVLAGFGVYLLARYVLKQLGLRRGSWWAAFAGGVIFTFSPFHMAHLLGHMQVFSLTWPPFYVLWLLRTVNWWRLAVKQSDSIALSDNWFGLKGLSAKGLALTGLFLALATTVDWYQTLYLLLYTVLVVGWALWSVWRDQGLQVKILLKPALGLVGIALALGLVFSPLIVPMAIEATTADYMRPSFEENVILSADLLAFFTPSELHPWWGKWVKPIYQNFTTTTSEQLIFAGFVPLSLAIYAAVRYRRRRLVQFWVIFSFVFFVLALGPYLHIAGEIVQVGDMPLPMPYLLLYKVVPFIGISRSLSRFDLMLMMGLGVLASVGLAWVKWPGQIFALVLICFEFMAIPYPMSPIDTPEFFKTIARDQETYTIAALPMNWDRPSPLLYQTVHRKDLLTAYTSRQNPLDLTWRTPVLHQWRTLGDDIIRTDLAAVAPTILHDFKIRYIVLDYYQMPPGPEREGTERWVAAALPAAEPIYNDGRLKVYRAPPLIVRQPYLQLGQGWGPLQIPTDSPSRIITDIATVNVVGDDLAGARLEIETLAPHSLQGLMALAGQTPLAVSVSRDGLEATIEILPGTETLTLIPTVSLPITRLQLISP